MTDSWVRRATDTANSIYEDFFQQVVAKHIIEKDRSRALSDKQQQQFDKGTHIDPRFVRLMAISGKGGYSDNPKLMKNYQDYKNCSLLDHLLSVTRGSLVFAAMDYLSNNSDMEDDLLRCKLSAIAVIAFLHDIDKDLEIERDKKISTNQVEERCKRYGIDQYLAQANVKLNTEQILYLIEKVEVGTANNTPSKTRIPFQYNDIYTYPRFADKLDGQWLSLTSGITGVLDYLENNNILSDKGVLYSQWKIVDIFDPHHPFLLDELQQLLSITSYMEVKIYPLIEIHEDGHLLILLPKVGYDNIIEKALNKLCQKRLPFSLELMVSAKGFPSLSNGQPSLKELQLFIKSSKPPKPSIKALSDLFRLNTKIAANIKENLINLLLPYQIPPSYPNASGATQYLYATKEINNFSHTQYTLFSQLACASLLVNLLVNNKKVINFEQREQDLINVCGELPTWITEIEEARTRRIVITIWAVIEAKKKPELKKLLDDVLNTWLEGNDSYTGLRYAITGIGAEVSTAVYDHFQQLLHHKKVTVKDETATGRCVFTDEPVPFKQTIDSKSGLYAVKVSAFSGRENRPEAFNSAKAHTNVGYVSIAEYRLRAKAHQQQGGKNDGVPNLISSPTTSGLFAGLQCTDEKELRDIVSYSVFDLSRQEKKKGTYFIGGESYTTRCRVARFEVMPAKLIDQVERINLLLRAALRFGRPVHIFRGLPTQRPEFFYYDALPSLLKQLLGGNGLRLEQINGNYKYKEEGALQKLQFTHALLSHHNFGYEIVQLYINPHTRFKAICFILCELLQEDNDSDHNLSYFRSSLIAQFFEQREQLLYLVNSQKGLTMDEKQDKALVFLGEKATKIQKYVDINNDSNTQQVVVFNLCLETVLESCKTHLSDQHSLINAVAGELEENLIRRDLDKKYPTKQAFLDECISFAKYFVVEVWQGVMKSRTPSQRQLRILRSMYRVAFIQKCNER